MPKQRYIAFLRAINAGGHVVKMDQLRTVFEALGFANVATFIASGNVIFETGARNAQRLERQIEARLRRALGYEVATLLRSPSELAAIATFEPFPPAEMKAEGASLYIMFVQGRLSPETTRELVTFRTPVDELRGHEREIYWLCRGRFSDSQLNGARLAKMVAMPATVRNATTVRKLAAKYA